MTGSSAELFLAGDGGGVHRCGQQGKLTTALVIPVKTLVQILVVVGVQGRKQALDRNLKKLANLNQMGRRDSYDARLVVSDLVSGNPEREPQLILAQATCNP
jgi:hypothetical protein